MFYNQFLKSIFKNFIFLKKNNICLIYFYEKNFVIFLTKSNFKFSLTKYKFYKEQLKIIL